MIRFLTTCGEDNLTFLLHPPRLQKALEILDTDKSGEVDIARQRRLCSSHGPLRCDTLCDRRGDSTRVAEPTVELDVVASMASSRDYVASIDAVEVAV